MLKRNLAWSALFAMVFASSQALAAGFGLYEMDSYAVGVGGHVYAKPHNAATGYYNPAGLTSLTGTWVTVGFTTLHPTMDTKVDGHGAKKMDPGCFFVPNAFVSQELPGGFTAGIGFYADYGLGSHYRNSWPLAWNSVESKFSAYTVNPNLAYKITDDWSVAAGLRLVHASFMQRRKYFFDSMYSGAPMYGLASRVYGPFGRMNFKMDVDNDVDYGYVLATRYQILDNLSVGAIWRSRVRCRFEGDAETSGSGYIGSAQAASHRGKIDDKIDLPMSATLGVNWDIIEPLHFGASITWTEWSTIDKIQFRLPAGMQTMNLKWHDAWRTGLGFSYDFGEHWTAMVGYCYDWDPSSESHPNTMLPPGDRHIISFGAAYHRGNWEIAASYAMIIMEEKTSILGYEIPSSLGGGRVEQRFETENPYTHAVSVSLTYHF